MTYDTDIRRIVEWALSNVLRYNCSDNQLILEGLIKAMPQ